MSPLAPTGAAALLVAACASVGCAPQAPRPAPAPAPAYADVRIDGVPHVLQAPDLCGEACAEMALRRLGSDVSQRDVFALAAIDPALGRGAVTAELAVALEALGFQVGDPFHEVRVARAAEELEALFAALHADLARGVPSIVCTRFDERPDTTEHFRLVVGYQARTDEILYHDPAIPGGAYLRMPRARFLALWPLGVGPDTRTVVRFPLAPGPGGPPRAARRAPGFSPADLALHVRALRQERLPAGFTVVVAPPFVVIGDAGDEAVRASAEHTVRWAVEGLKREYFPADPPRILDVWLFRDRESYERNARALFGEAPHTPYGYYSERHGALVMNIATGGGTLVHEIVHPFLDANFPARPAWLSEGLASLYEQCGTEGGRIWGYTNWRLAGLQEAIRAGRVPPFERLMALTEEEFYRDDRGTNYAQSRYLLHYLQGKGLLGRFYHEFRAHHRDDPTGIATLRSVLGERDLPAFQRRWEEHVLGLTFP